jgi:peptide/nickel transport system permease protein
MLKVKKILSINKKIFASSFILSIVTLSYLIILLLTNSRVGYLHYTTNLDNKNLSPSIFMQKSESFEENIDPKIPNVGYHRQGNDIEILIEDVFYNEYDNHPNEGSDEINYYILGTNSEGRDIFTFLFLGFEIYLLGGLLSLFTAIILGITIGVISSYYQKTLLGTTAELVLQTIANIPKVTALFIAVVIFGINVYSIMITIGILSSVKIASALKQRINLLKNLEFVDAAKQLGVSDSSIIFKHLLFYNSRDLLITYFAFIIADTILLETTMAYLNFGVDWVNVHGYTVISWGTFLKEGKEWVINGVYWILLFPALLTVTLIFSFNLLGEGLKEKYHIN